MKEAMDSRTMSEVVMDQCRREHRIIIVTRRLARTAIDQDHQTHTEEF